MGTTLTDALAQLKRKGTKAGVAGMARFAIVARKAYGVSVADVRAIAKKIGRDHDLAARLWKSGWYEARLLAVFVEDPALVTSRQMDAWVRDFENWADCDAACFHLFDKTPLAWKKIEQWSTRKEEFEKRAAFALLASVALHDKQTPDAPFLRALPLIQRGATDERNFVKKGVSWALRGIGHRNARLRSAEINTAVKLAASKDPASRWIGRDTIRDLSRT
jgi:3-methyladenine DNA glycosylase AlkD